MDLFLDLHQYRAIGEAKRAAEDAAGRVAGVDRRVDELERRIDRLALASQALWEILRERTGVSDETVFARMQEIDLRDGVADGRISPQAAPCASCGRAVSSRRRVCLYCGTPSPHSNIAH